MNDDLDGDEAMKNFEGLGRKLLQAPKESVDDEAEDITEDEPQADG